MKKIALCMALALSFLLTGCGGTTPPVTAAQAQPGQYLLGPGDHLRVIIFGHDEMSGQFTIDPSGRISLPLVGAIDASGVTVSALEQRITNALKPQYLQDPKVSVEVLEYRPVYILGEVRTPGKYPYVPDMTVLQAVAIAGGHTYRAQEGSAEITRNVQGSLKTFDVDAHSVIQPGDTVTIERRWF